MSCGSIIEPCPGVLTGSSAQLFYTLINTLMASQCSLGPSGKYPPDYGPSLVDGQEFDFIVVGSGSAGSVVGSRLSKINEWDVLVLEAGSFPSATSETPLLALTMIGTYEDWQYKMQPGACCKGLKGNVCACSKGKLLGGSSSMNAMAYIRGNRRDYTKWDAETNSGWDYETLMKYYKSFENVQDQDGDEYGRNGELEITRYQFDHPIHDILSSGFEELDYSKYTEIYPLGYLDSYVTIYQGTRNNAAKAFLGKAKERKNLKVALKVQVSRVLIDPETKTTYGVEVQINDTILVLIARKEVILSAGAIASPQILMHSGIGPREVLQPLGINVVQDLNVGKNLQDHFIHPIFISLDPSVLKPRSDVDAVTEIYQYFVTHQGLYATIELINFLGFVNTKNDSIYPNIQTMMHIAYPNDTASISTILNTLNLPEEMYNDILSVNKQKAILSFVTILLNPKSRGQIVINSTNPFDYPLIYPNYLSDALHQDEQTALEGIRWAEKLFETDALKEYGATIITTGSRNCNQYEFRSNEYWKCSMHNIGSHIFHQTATCKMGSYRDRKAVVDPRLRVRGVKNLRVIDASIMPFVTSGNTNAPSMMIGAKGAAMIIADHKGFPELTSHCQ